MAETKSKKAETTAETKSKMVTAFFSPDPMTPGENQFTVGVNGKLMRIPYGENVEIPEEYLEAIENANKESARAIAYQIKIDDSDKEVKI